VIADAREGILQARKPGISTGSSPAYGDDPQASSLTAGAGRRKKRLWTDEEKRSICFQTTARGVSVAQVARRYAANANLIFKWLRDPRFASDPAAVPSPAAVPRFLPAEIVAEAQAPQAAPAPDGHIEIEKP